VAYFLEVGLLLMVLPWSAYWEHNYFAEAWPALAPVITNHFVRGGVMGLGLVNVVAGVEELRPVLSARQRHDPRLRSAAGASVSVQTTADRAAQSDGPPPDTRVEP
jgi:hypothetical protein